MFSTISWGQYFSAIALLLSVYYAFVGCYYYAHELGKWLGSKKMPVNESSAITSAGINTYPDGENKQPHPENEVPDQSGIPEAFTDELNALLNGLPASISDQELLLSLQNLLNKYPSLKRWDDAEVMADFVFNQTITRFPYLIEFSEVLALWS